MLLLLATNTLFSAAASLAPARDLRVEYAETPVQGVAVRRPRFGWSLEHPERGASQASYRVTVREAGAAPPSSAAAWDSGVVRSNATLGVRCGAALRSDTDYELTVVWSDERGATAAPATARFSTALLDAADWHGAEWLTLPNATDTRSQFRAALALPPAKAVRRGVCYVAGLGYQRSFLNGERLASSPDDTLGPFLQFQRRVAYDTYDVTSQLRPGANTLAVLLGRGWYSLPEDPFTAVLGYRTIGPRALRVLCSIALEDGTALRFATGTPAWPWRHGSGERVSDHLFLGETIDKRLATPGWELNGFDDSGWALATTAPPPPPPPPAPKIPLDCPAGQRVDFVEDEGDNGTCDCVSRHDTAAIWVAFFSRCQRSRC